MRDRLIKKLESTVAEGINKQAYRNSLDELHAESRLDVERAEYKHLTAELSAEVIKIRKRIARLCYRLGYSEDTKKSLTHLIYCATKQFEKDENGIVKGILPACNCMFTIEEWDFKGTDALSQS